MARDQPELVERLIDRINDGLEPPVTAAEEATLDRYRAGGFHPPCGQRKSDRRFEQSVSAQSLEAWPPQPKVADLANEREKHGDQ